MKKATVFKGLLLGFVAAILFAAQPALAQDNIITGGDFSGGELPAEWTTFFGEGASGTISIVNGEVAVSDIQGTTGTSWHIQLNQILSTQQIDSLVTGEVYTIKFDARGAVDGREIRYYFGEDGGGFATVSASAVTLSDVTQTYEYTFTLNNTYGAMKMSFEMGQSNDDVFIDNVELFKGGTLEEPVATGLDLPVTFEDTELDYGLTDFGGNASEIVQDPTNAGNMVAKTVKSGTAETWAGTTVGADTGFDSPIPFAEGQTTMTVRVWSPAADTPVRLKVEDASNGSISVETEVNTTVGGAWETLEFDFSNQAEGTTALDLANTYNKASIFFNFGAAGADAGELTYYWDDMDFVEPSAGDQNLPVTFEDVDLDYGLTDFGNNQSEIVVDPTDASNMVAKTTKPDNAELWAGTTVFGATGFSDPLPFEPGSTTLSVRVWSPTAGTPILLKVEDASDAAISVETQVSTTVAEEWETLEFDFSNQVEGTPAINFGNTYNKASIFFNFGTTGADAGAQTYYWDDMDFVESGEPVDPNPEFGDNKILFMDGPNVLIPRIDGATVEDVVEPGNLVHRFTGGAFFELGYFWDLGGFGGVDFTQNMADVDTVYLRIRINPADHTDAEGNLRQTGSLMLADVTTGTNSNLQWGIAYPLAEFYDNEWHDLAIPLPKPTIAEHDSALKGLDLNGDPLPESEQYSEEQMKWTFPTAWNGSVDVSPNDPELGGDPEWENLGRIVVRQGNNQSGTFYVDDFYIGSRSDIDLSVATELPDLPGNVVTTAENGEVSISWEHDETSNIYNYELYYSGSQIGNIEDDGVKFIGSFRTSDALNYSHGVELPHPSVSGVEYHYAVVPTTQYSIKSPTNFTGQSVTATGDVMPYIFELTEEQELQIISDLESGEINAESWPTDDFEPFTLTSENVEQTDASAQVWMAFGRADGFQTIYLYVEAYDDDILAGPEAAPSDMFGTTVYPRINQDPTWIPDIGDNENQWSDMDLEWNYYLKDQLKIHFGTYDVDFATGTTNEYRRRGEKPDYFLSLQPKMSTESTDPGPDGMLTRFWVTEHNDEDPDVVYNTLYYNSNHQFTFSSLYENIMNGETRTGWRAMVAFDVNDLLVATNDSDEPIDDVLELPAEEALKYIPIRFELWDKDSGDGGNWWEVPSHVLSYPTSLSGGGNNEWEDDISMLGVAAMAGSGVSTSNERLVDAPMRFSLSQNYPNPFNPTTKIGFTLPSNQKVKLSVFNILGQRVATLIDGQQMASGAHTVNFDASMLSSGLYIYRIEAGSFTSSKKMMLIK